MLYMQRTLVMWILSAETTELPQIVFCCMLCHHMHTHARLSSCVRMSRLLMDSSPIDWRVLLFAMLGRLPWFQPSSQCDLDMQWRPQLNLWNLELYIWRESDHIRTWLWWACHQPGEVEWDTSSVAESGLYHKQSLHCSMTFHPHVSNWCVIVIVVVVCVVCVCVCVCVVWIQEGGRVGGKERGREGST